MAKARIAWSLLAAGIGRPEQYVVVAPGIGLGTVPERASARRELGLPDDRPIVLFVGRLVAVKRPERVVERRRTND